MTQDEIIPLPQYLNASYEGDDLFTGKQLIEYAKLVAQAEREACAKVIENYPTWLGKTAKTEISNAIRARGEQA
jgi:hypothetical protein